MSSSTETAHHADGRRMVRLLLTGDVMLGRGVDQILPYHCHPRIYESCVHNARDYVALALEANGPLPEGPPVSPAYPWGVALADLAVRRPDAMIINLETAVTVHDVPWPCKPINYRMHPGNVLTLTAVSASVPTVASLANNHTLDWGLPGLEETLHVLASAGIRTAGAGRDADEARRPAVVPVVHEPAQPAAEPAAAAAATAATATGPAAAPESAAATAVAAAGERSSGSSSCSNGASRVLVWAVGHSSSGVPAEWAAGARRPGVFMTDLSPRDVGQLGDMVRAEKRPGLDVAVVSVHWGPNWGYDVPRQHQRFARMLIDHAGVDCVHGHSSHHAMGCELYRGKLIMYGAGDLISDYEGIQNPYIQAEYPPHLYRDDVGLLWYADLDSEDGTLRELNMVPTRLRHLRLEAPEPDDWRYVETMMDRECRKLGIAAGVRRVRAAEGDALHMQFLAGQ